MGISLKQAFCFVPQDSKWVSKVFIGGLLLFFPTFVYIFPGIRRMIFDPMNYYMVALFIMLTLTLLLAISGYFFKAVHNRIVHQNGKLPSWKYFSYYIYIGVKSYIGGFIFSIPFLVMFLLLMAFAPLTASMQLVPFLIAVCILHVIYTAMYIMLALKFSMDFRISSFLNIKKAYDLIKDNILNYVIVVLYCLLVALCNFILSMLLIHGQIFALLLPFVTFYVYLVYTDLFAQFALNCDERCADESKCFV